MMKGKIMKHIYLNLKRFDILPEFGGINRLSDSAVWGKYIVENTKDEVLSYSPEEVEFVQYYPEAHIIPAVSALDGSSLRVGSQGVYRSDTVKGGNFGAFTSNRTANSMISLGVKDTLIGHCEERNDLNELFSMAGSSDRNLVNRVLNKEIREAQRAGMKVLYCIGEKESELDSWKEVLKEQVITGLEGVDRSNVVLGYEPVWSIGPGKVPADKEYISKIAKYLKEISGGMDIVYGGGLKKDNAEMLASIPEISGGLIALTRFSGEDFGFYPDEYKEIVKLYLGK